jgi:hypothetical protein
MHEASSTSHWPIRKQPRERDRLKKAALLNVLSELPQHVQDQWADAQKGVGHRKRETAFVNNVMVRNGPRKYTYNVDQPMFTEYKHLWESNFGKDQKRGPMSVRLLSEVWFVLVANHIKH